METKTSRVVKTARGPVLDERGMSAADRHEELARLRQQNAALLEALEGLEYELSRWTGPDADAIRNTAIFAQARAAIAAARGEP